MIQNRIYEVNGIKIMLDFDLASLYEAETRVLNQAIKRNKDSFPDDFMFQLTAEEWAVSDQNPNKVSVADVTAGNKAAAVAKVKKAPAKKTADKKPAAKKAPAKKKST